MNEPSIDSKRLKATREHVAHYVQALSVRPNPKAKLKYPLSAGIGLANATLRQRVTAVQLLYDYIMEETLRLDNPVGRGRYTPGHSFGGHRERGLLPTYHKLPWIRDSPYLIWPNPVGPTGQFTVSLDEPDSAIITLSRLDGRAVSFRKTATTNHSITLRLVDQPTGSLYLLTIEERGQSRPYRLLIE